MVAVIPTKPPRFLTPQQRRDLDLINTTVEMKPKRAARAATRQTKRLANPELHHAPAECWFG